MFNLVSASITLIKPRYSSSQPAASEGAEIILLPELLPNGYGLNESVWDGAEPIDGHSVNWLTGQAHKHGAYIGFTFLETDGSDFYNAFVLANPSGEVAGRVRKSPAPAVESYFYKEGQDNITLIQSMGELGSTSVMRCYCIAVYVIYMKPLSTFGCSLVLQEGLNPLFLVMLHVWKKRC
ncbi:MAG: carbon-nitrogen hydrolase family protein [Gammaproteobacteria bacterium]|nr:carbon-nitrogen hydrolase family protein [Gammaproteobacteria bacterium]